jgi:hypothetical protein
LLGAVPRWHPAGMAEQETCDACEQPWEALFEWSYTDPEHYCGTCLLDLIDEQNQPGITLLDYMPDCQQITHRVPGLPGRAHLHSTTELQMVMLGRVGRPGLAR